MRTPDEAIDLIAQEEGFEPDWYQDVAGVWTIGYGHTGRNTIPFLTPPISEFEAREVLRSDVVEAEGIIARLVDVDLHPWQFGALVSFVFNLGAGNFGRSTLRRLVNAGDFEGAAREFRKWRRAGGEIQPGLLSRRGREEQLFRMGSSAIVNLRV